MRRYTLQAPNPRFAGLMRTEWQVHSYLSDFPDRVRRGFASRVIFSGTKAECEAILDGREYAVMAYRTGREICRGHYTPAGNVIVRRVKPYEVKGAILKNPTQVVTLKGS